MPVYLYATSFIPDLLYRLIEYFVHCEVDFNSPISS